MAKKPKRFIIKFTAGVMSAVTTTTGVIHLYKYILNPNLEESCYDGYSINDFVPDYSSDNSFELVVQGDYSSFEDVLNSINTDEKIEVKKAKALYYAIENNTSLKKKEKELLKNLIPYFVDNSYINHEQVFNKLISFTINRNDPSLLDEGISAKYLDDNSITFANNEERNYSYSHEILHCIENENLSYEYYSWFGEGVACLLNFEYMGHYEDGNNMKAYFIRALCELVDPDVILECSAKGEISYLAAALQEKGIDLNRINRLFRLFEKYNENEFSDPESIPSISYEIINLLIEMYNIAYNEPEIVSGNFYKILNKIMVPETLDNFVYYYFNSREKSNNKSDDLSITQKDLLSFYDRMKKEEGKVY